MKHLLFTSLAVGIGLAALVILRFVPALVVLLLTTLMFVLMALSTLPRILRRAGGIKVVKTTSLFEAWQTGFKRMIASLALHMRARSKETLAPS